MSSLRSIAIVGLLACASNACVVSPGASSAHPREGLPKRDRPFIAVLSGEMPGAIREVGRHSWVVANVQDPSGRFRYRRFEWLGDAKATDSDNPYAYFGEGAVAVHGVVAEDAAKIATMVACLERETKAYHEPNCGCWPGPNSNTFADGLIRACCLGIELPATAVGKDYRGPLGASFTEGRTGVQLETWLGGVKIGAKEGVGADLVGLSLGVHFWPPGLDVPVDPGRIGLDASVRRPPDPTAPESLAWPAGDHVDHRYGAASIAMAVAYDRTAEPSAASGLSDRALVGLEGHGVFGTTVGYAFGFDVGVGAGAPLGAAYSAHLHPAGIGIVLGDTGLLAATSGIGTSGVSSTLRGALELPQALRVEVDIARIARLGLHGGVVVVPDADDRGTIETFFGATTRLGTRASGRFERRSGSGAGSGGFFFGLERREISRTYLLGASFGYEIGVGG